MAEQTGVKKKSWVKRLLLVGGIGLVVLVVGAYVLIPVIGGAIGPGRIEQAANASLQGSVKVGGVSVSWGGPTRLTGVELRDPEGNVVGVFDVESELGIWRVLGGLSDIGTAKVGGRLTLVRTVDATGKGTTNLERAVAPRGGPKPVTPGQKDAGTLPGMKGVLEITGLDATFEERTPSGVSGQAAMKGLKGQVAFATSGTGSVDATLDAGFADTLNGPASGTLSVMAKGDGFVESGKLAAGKANFDATVAAKGVPVNLLDALANQGGVLAGVLGATADATVKAKGSAGVIDADIVLTSPNASADLAVKTENGRLHATRKGNASLRSLAFAGNIPGLAKSLSDAGVTVDADGWPGAKVSIEGLDIPAGGPAAAGAPSGAASWAGAKVDLRAFTTGPIKGTLRRPGASVAEPLVIRAATIGVISADMSRGVDLVGDTGATVGGQSAGELDLNVQASGLVDNDGHLVLLNGGLPARIAGRFEARGVATGLLAPFVATSGLPLDLAQDVGPTLDLTLSAVTKGGTDAKAGGTPPTDITLEIVSANVKLKSTLLYDSSGVGIVGEPTRLVIERGSGVVQRLLKDNTAPGTPAPSVRGAARVEVELPEARLPVSGKKLDFSVASARGTVTLTDLATTLTGTRAIDLGVERVSLSVLAIPRTVSRVFIEGRLAVEGSPADLRGQLQLTGLLEEQELPRIGGLQTRRLAGELALKGLSGQAVRGVIAGPSASPALKSLASELVGKSVDIKIDLGEKTSGSTQTVRLTLTGGLNASVRGELGADAFELAGADAGLTITDGLAKAVLELAGQGGAATGGARLREPTDLSMNVQAVSVPLRSGTLDPDWARGSGILLVQGALSRPALLDGLAVEGRTLSAGVAGFTLDTQMPLAMLAPSGAEQRGIGGAGGLKLSAGMDLVGSGPADVLAKLRVAGGGGTAGDPLRISATFAEVATARLDQIIGQQGLLPDLLGERATLIAVLAKPASGPMTVSLDVDAPRVSVKGAQLLVTDDAFATGGPFTATVEAHPSLFAPRGAGTTPTSVRIGEPFKASLSIARLKLSRGEGAGLFRPGTFELDAVASMPRVVVVRIADGQNEATELGEVSASLKSTGNASRVGITYSAGVGSVRSTTGAVTEPTVVRGTLDNIADVAGNMQPDLAVLSLTAKTGKLPTPVLDALAGTGGQIGELMGPELTADIEARDVSKSGTGGFVTVKLRSPKANLSAAGPVTAGVWDTGAPGATPLRAELSEFKFATGGKLLSIFPIFAEVQRTAATGTDALGAASAPVPATLVTRGLRIPVDGDMSKLNGAIDVNIGKMEYVFSQALGGLLDDTIFRGGRGVDQRPVPPFTVTIERGIVRYGSIQQKVVLPVRNLDFQTRGVVDLVGRRIDVVTYVPTIAAAPGLVANLNKTVGGALGKLVPSVVEKVTAAPLRTSGPLDNPTTGYAPDVVLDEFKDVLKPENIIKGIGDLLGGGKEEPKPAPAPQPAAPAQPTRPRR